MKHQECIHLLAGTAPRARHEIPGSSDRVRSQNLQTAQMLQLATSGCSGSGHKLHEILCPSARMEKHWMFFVDAHCGLWAIAWWDCMSSVRGDMLTCFWSDLREAFAAAERSWELQGVYLGPLSLEARTTRPNTENGLTGQRRIHIFSTPAPWKPCSTRRRNFVFLDKAAFSALNVRRPGRPECETMRWEVLKTK